MYAKNHATLLNKALFIPLVVGIVHTITNYKHKKNTLLLSLALVICVLPVFLTFGHFQPRRYLLYSIPIYIFIGIGGARIIQYFEFIKAKIIKKIIFLTLGLVSLCIVLHEFAYTATSIWNSDLEFIISNYSNKQPNDVVTPYLITMDFQDVIFSNFMKATKNMIQYNYLIFYLQETPRAFSRGFFDFESSLLTLILRNENRNCYVANITTLKAIGGSVDKAYVVKSPFISKEDFLKMCDKENLLYKLIASPSPATSPENMERFLATAALSGKFELIKDLTGIDKIKGPMELYFVEKRK